MIDAVLANDRTVYLFVGRFLPRRVAEPRGHATTWRGLGRVRNTLADTGRVDASFVRGEHTFLFSGDQYVRYTGAEYAFVDEGYPRSIAASLPGELGVAALPEQFHDGIDAALADAERPGVPVPRAPVRGHRRARAGAAADRRDVGPGAQPVRSTTPTTPAIDAAFVSRDGSLFAFKGDQYLRYATPDGRARRRRLPAVDQGRLGGPPAGLRGGAGRRLRLRGRHLLRPGEQYVRYSGGDFRRIDRTYPQPLVRRWGRWADYLLTDLRVISRFKQLQDRTSTATAAWPRC